MMKFPKKLDAYRALTVLGNNLVVSDFHEWKRFRKIAAPSFNEVKQSPPFRTPFYMYLGKQETRLGCDSEKSY
jgi:hypothetical protein